VRPSLRAALVGTLATATLGLTPSAFADIIQDDVVEADSQVITLVPGSAAGVTAHIRVVGNNADGPTTDPGCNWDAGEAPLVLDIVTPAGVTASPAQVSLTSCGGVGEPVTFTAAAGASAGNATVSVVSTPAGGGGYTSQVSITIVLASTNTAPTGVADSYTTAEDTPKVVSASGVLGNDTDPQGDALSAEKVSDPTHGIVSLAANGSFTYTPAADYSGSDSFTYKAIDAGGLSSTTTTVSLTVTPVNDAPLALDDSASTDEDAAVDVAVLGNDSDIDGGALTVTGASDGAHGTTTYDADSVIYTPAPDFFGTDSFTYSVSDGNGGTDSATVTVTVSNVNDAPVANDDSASTDEDTPLVVSAASGVLANDTDVDGDGLTTAVVAGPTHAASFALDADGSYSYTPEADWFGTDSFTYRAADGSTTSGVATVSLTVAPVNDAPVADDETLTVAEDSSGSVGVLTGDTDVDGDTLSVSGVTDGDHGTVANNSDGTVTYTPAADFFGTDSFTYTVCDDHATTPASAPGCDTATVSVTVTAVNDAPDVTAGPDASANEGAVASISATFADVDQAVGETYTASIAWGDGSTSAGTVTGDTVTASHTYADDEAGAADDIYQAVVTVTDSGTTDGAAAPKTGTATVPVTVSNVAPTVPAPSLVVNPFTGVLTLSTTFTDPAGSNDSYAGSFSVDGTTVAGTVSGMTLGTTVDLEPGCHTISATATVSDGDGGSTTSASGSSGSGVDVYAVSFQAPIRDDARNVAKYGNVVPVKVQVVSSCTGLPVTATPLSIQLVKGNVTDDVTVDDTNAALTESVSSADSGTQMRVADGKYIYNLSTKGLTVGADYTVRIRAGSSSTTSPIILRALLSTRK
jgi:VCBS repeat-containing protein